MPINSELLEILQCPKCKGDVRLDASENKIVCDCCGLLYELREGIPIMLVEESIATDDSPALSVDGEAPDPSSADS